MQEALFNSSSTFPLISLKELISIISNHTNKKPSEISNELISLLIG